MKKLIVLVFFAIPLFTQAAFYRITQGSVSLIKDTKSYDGNSENCDYSNGGASATIVLSDNKEFKIGQCHIYQWEDLSDMLTSIDTANNGDVQYSEETGKCYQLIVSISVPEDNFYKTKLSEQAKIVACP